MNIQKAGAPKRFPNHPYSFQAFIISVLFHFFLIFLVSGRAQSEALPFVVEWQDGQLSVTAEKVPLDQILYEVARKTGLKIEVPGEIEKEFSVKFSNFSLLEGLHRLLSRINHVILLQETSESPKWEMRVTRVMVLGEGSKPLRTIHGEPEIEVEDGKTDGLPALYASAKQGDIGALKKALFNPNHTIQAVAFELLAQRDRKELVELLIDAAKSKEAEVRRQSLELLHYDYAGIAENKIVLAALGKAVFDENTNVKDYAIKALAEHGGAEAMEHLRVALNDPEPAVRMMAIENIARTTQRELIFPILREALSDDHEVVRSLAASWLGQLFPMYYQKEGG